MHKIGYNIKNFFMNIFYWIGHINKLGEAKQYKKDIKVENTTHVEYYMNLFKWKEDKPWDWTPWVITICARKLEDDCISIDEEIYTEHGIKRVADLNIGDKVLSYDFKNNKQCYSEIDKIWEKGELETEKVYFGRGENIRSVVVTPNTPFLHRTNQKGNSKYKKEILSNIDLKKWYIRKIPTATKIQYNSKDINWLNNDFCFIIGHFLAEGWITNYKYSRPYSSGFDINEHIIPKLEKNKIPYSLSKNKNGTPQIEFLKSPFKDFLVQKFNFFSINKRIPEEIFKLPELKLKNILDGYFLGDGHIHKGSKYYSTISNKLSSDIVRIHLQLGLPIGGYLQSEHQGLGKNPIWKIHSSETNKSFKNRGYTDLGEVSILRKEKNGKVKTRDFRVKDTHVFFLKNGVMCHNCDGAATLGQWLLSQINIESDLVVLKGNDGNHMVCVNKNRTIMISNKNFVIINNSNEWEEEILNWSWHKDRYQSLYVW